METWQIICSGQARLVEEADYVDLDEMAREGVPDDVHQPSTETTVFDDITKVKSKFLKWSLFKTCLG